MNHLLIEHLQGILHHLSLLSVHYNNSESSFSYCFANNAIKYWARTTTCKKQALPGWVCPSHNHSDWRLAKRRRWITNYTLPLSKSNWADSRLVLYFYCHEVRIRGWIGYCSSNNFRTSVYIFICKRKVISVQFVNFT